MLHEHIVYRDLRSENVDDDHGAEEIRVFLTALHLVFLSPFFRLIKSVFLLLYAFEKQFTKRLKTESKFSKLFIASFVS